MFFFGCSRKILRSRSIRLFGRIQIRVIRNPNGRAGNYTKGPVDQWEGRELHQWACWPMGGQESTPRGLLTSGRAGSYTKGPLDQWEGRELLYTNGTVDHWHSRIYFRSIYFVNNDSKEKRNILLYSTVDLKWILSFTPKCLNLL